MVQLRPHQQRVLDENPDRALLCHEGRTGKSLIGKYWSEHSSRNRAVLIICIKKNKKMWTELCPGARVVTKEEFKKDINSFTIPGALSGIVVDECHNFAGTLFIPKTRSQQAADLYTCIKANPEAHVLLLSATPITNNPASIHTLLCYLGRYIPWTDFRGAFYELKRMPYLPRPAYFPARDWREKADRLLQKYADIVSLADCVDSLPAVMPNEIIKVKTPVYEYEPEEERHWTIEHRHEQTLKYKVVKEMPHRKLIVVCHYTEQIDEMKARLEKDRPTFVMDGRTKDPEGVILAAQEASDCYFIVQAGMGEGWDGYMFGAMVFCSMPHRVLFHTQMRYRLTSVDYPKPALYYYLIGGAWDAKIYKSIMAGEDWNPHRASLSAMPTQYEPS